MKKRLVSCLSAALLFGGLATAGAENRSETFTLTPFIGGYTFEGEQHLKTMPAVGLRAGYNFTERFGTEAVFDYVRTEGTRSNEDANVFNYHLDLLYHFFPSAKAVPFLMAGYGVIDVDSDAGDLTKGAFNYGLGVKYALSDTMHLRGEVRHFIFKDSGNSLNNLEYGIGLGFPFGGAQPAPKPVAAVQEEPKPIAPPVVVPDGTLSVTPSPAGKGTMVTLSWECLNAASADIQPGIGAIPPKGTRSLTAEEATDFTLTCRGPGGTATAKSALLVSQPPACTIAASPATITEGQSASLDWECTNVESAEIQPEVGKVAAKGSRSVMPTETTSYKVTGTGTGATATGSATVKVNPLPPEKRTITLNVLFDTGKAEIKKKYHDEIGRVAAFLKEFPGVNGTIEGHTDNIGSAAANEKLSKRRADAVLEYLVEKFGIERSRLSAVGYGQTKPIADNKTAQGREKNRRTVAIFETMVKKKK